ncbi:M1 family metallopeptidase [Kineococcus sp. SYSU DK003]|uniref:M1 family metallopeptidase n=1 Tax=Kineococcus sp. SYSU DK003 TaxID=3383124 RepID=UPI003D7D6A37
MRRRLAVSSLVLSGVLGAGSAGSAAALPDPSAGFSPGAPGIGDRYFPLDGNGGYDVAGYELDLAYDPATDLLSGSAAITATATQDLTSFDLDLSGLDVASVTVDGVPSAFVRLGSELVVLPDTPVGVGRTFSTVVTYSGTPQPVQDALGTSGFMHTDDGAIVAGQPDGAATWFPVNDHPRDAATYDLSVTVPDGLTVVSNGTPGPVSTADGLSTWTWSARDPMASYLLTLAVGEFDVTTREVGGLTYIDALDPDLDGLVLTDDPEAPTAGQVARASLDRQPEIVDFLSGQFGEYPFETVGGIVDDDPTLGFALETQTRPVYSPVFFSSAFTGDSVVVHELAHQWFGDELRLAGWEHIWLNEGFATYAEWLWSGAQGYETPAQLLDLYAEGLAADDPFWSVTIGDPGPDALFDAAVYYRGAMTLQALREEVGDAAFFEILRTWYAGHRGQAVTIPQFTALAEEVSGADLDEFFTEWLFTPAKPASLG